MNPTSTHALRRLLPDHAAGLWRPPQFAILLAAATVACALVLTTPVGVAASALPQSTPGLTAPNDLADVRVDVDRDGLVDITGASDEAGEDRAGVEDGALFLANLDDDTGRCLTSLTPAQLYPGPFATGRASGIGRDDRLAACNDAADQRVNGTADELDLAPVRVVARPDAPEDARGRVSVVDDGSRYARLFVRQDGNWHAVPDSGLVLSAGQLRDGVQLGLEGRDIVRDARVWDGSVTVQVDITTSSGSSQDRAALRVAPVHLQHDLQPARRVLTGTGRSTFALPTENALRRSLEKDQPQLPDADIAQIVRTVLAFVSIVKKDGPVAAAEFGRSLSEVVRTLGPDAPALSRLDLAARHGCRTSSRRGGPASPGRTADRTR